MIHTKKKQVLVAMVTSGTNYPYSNSGNKKSIKKSSQRSIQKVEWYLPGDVWERWNVELLFNKYRVALLQDEMSFGDGWW